MTAGRRQQEREPGVSGELLLGVALSRLERARGAARRMVTYELIAARGAEPEGTVLWLALCEEAAGRAKWGSLNSLHVPDGWEHRAVLPGWDEASHDHADDSRGAA
jgi:hypothetical protein